MFIVEDNPWDRKGIAAMIDYKELGINRILSFEDGQEAFEALLESPPDIVLTDVAMPRLNGLQLAVKLHESYPGIKIIFMSCYSEFEYIKTALEMNSTGYILKSVEKDELYKVLEKAVGEINRERDNQLMVSRLLENTDRKKIQEQFITDFIFDSAGDEKTLRARFSEYRICLPASCGLCLISIAADKEVIEPEHDSYNPARYTLYKELEKVFEESLCETEKAVIVSTSYTEFIVFCIIDLTLRPLNGFTSVAMDTLLKLPKKYLTRISAGVSQVSGHLPDASNLYQQSIQAKENVFFGDSRFMVFSAGAEYELKTKIGKPQTNKNLYSDLRKLLSMGHEEDLQAFLDKYVQKTDVWQNELYIKNIAFMIVTMTRFIIQAEDVRSFDGSQAYGLEEFWKEIDSVRTIPELRKYLRESVLLDMSGLSQGGASHKAVIAEQIKNSIKANYGRHLTVKDIAQEVNFSSIYISNLFKQVTGKTIFEYLTQVRMEKAMELLKKPESRIYLVADEVGITNKSYFCLAFKRHTGLSPSEYKNKAKF